ncbi:MAG TPA: glycosyl hydrolase [Vicinamibacteria bacterium]|nr:glycosyl hydrolase [Vicinamibacteria bacterium]
MTTAALRPILCFALLLAALPARADDGKIAREKDPLRGLEFRLVGPFVGGRVARVTGVAGDPRTYYAATASGGVWKSTSGGHDWKPVFDDQPIASIGSIAVAPSDPSVVYVGSGEANIRGNVAAGNGIYKSVDGGKNWIQVWKQEGQIGTMAVHPRNPDIAFAAVLGHAFGPNAERGIYRTRDGGKTWQQVLKKDADTGGSDVAIDPSNPSVVFAGLWQARRRPWEMTSGGPGSGLYVSRDGGESWKALNKDNGLPEGIWGKVGVAVAPSDSRRVYAVVEAEKGGLFRSDDGGESWSLASGHHALRQRAWYYSTITVDPRNPDVLWCPQVPMLRSVDGGKTWKKVKGIHHGDHHDLWIDPADTRRMISANDGGVDVTLDGGESWFSPRLPIGQCYHVDADNSQPYRVSCALQDLGTGSGPSNSLSSDGINYGDWYDVGGGEAGHTASDPSDPSIVYAGEYLGILTRYDHRTGQARAVGAWPDNQSGHGDEDGRYRFQWTAPIVVSPHDPKVVYHGGNVLFRTSDGGQSWTAISPDLTTNDKSKQKWSGGPITGDNTGVEHYCTIFAVAESPLTKGLIWVGSDDGLVHVTRDGGATWTNVTANIHGIPAFGTVDLIEASHLDPGTAYVVVDAHRLDDMRPYLYKTTDYGKTWKSLSAGLAPDVYLHAVREDPKKKGMLYAGTERGVMLSRDDGATWEPLKLNLPAVAVHDLVVKGDDLVLATHGRSIWILDDLTPIREMSPEVKAKSVHLFPAPVTTAWRYRGSFHEDGPGENPPAGLVVQYWLKEKPKGDVTLEVSDAAGTLVRKLSSKEDASEIPPDDPDAERSTKRKPPLSAEAGVNRGKWNLMWAGATRITRAKIDTGDPENGPLVVPGTYTLKLSADGQTSTATVEVRPDPRVQMTAAERAEQLRFGIEVRDAITRLAADVESIRSVRDQLRTRGQLLAANGAAASWVKAAGDVVPRLDALEAELHNPKAEVAYDILAQRGGAKLYSQITPLLDWVRDADGVPTQGMKEIFAERLKELSRLEAEWKGLQASSVQPLNEQARALGFAYVTVPAEPSRR